jgi:peptidoglycan/LPS O-acetylase OafA/YrhL
MNRTGHLPALEGLRGYAAFLVYLVHAFGLLAAQLNGLDADRHLVWTDHGVNRALLVFIFRSHYGVDLFFVLSGLFMADLAVRRWPGTTAFLRQRWLRIYPAYFVSVVVVALLSWLWFGQTFSTGEFLGNLVLWQGFFILDIAAVNPVTWSLSYEAVFYLAVPALALLWRTRGQPGTATLSAASLIIIAVAAAIPVDKVIYLAYFALFVPGVTLGLMTNEHRQALSRRLPLWVVIGAWAAFTLAFKLEVIANTGPTYYVVSSVACGLVVLKACDAEGMLARTLASPILGWLGRYSYSFFLIHYAVVQCWGAWLADRLPAVRLGYSLAFLAGSLATSLVAARLLWAGAERVYFHRAKPGVRGSGDGALRA